MLWYLFEKSICSEKRTDFREGSSRSRRRCPKTNNWNILKVWWRLLHSLSFKYSLGYSPLQADTNQVRAKIFDGLIKHLELFSNWYLQFLGKDFRNFETRTIRKVPGESEKSWISKRKFKWTEFCLVRLFS